MDALLATGTLPTEPAAAVVLALGLLCVVGWLALLYR